MSHRTDKTLQTINLVVGGVLVAAVLVFSGAVVYQKLSAARPKGRTSSGDSATGNDLESAIKGQFDKVMREIQERSQSQESPPPPPPRGNWGGGSKQQRPGPEVP
jgi:hypothetical protein